MDIYILFECVQQFHAAFNTILAKELQHGFDIRPQQPWEGTSVMVGIVPALLISLIDCLIKLILRGECPYAPDREQLPFHRFQDLHFKVVFDWRVPDCRSHELVRPHKIILSLVIVEIGKIVTPLEQKIIRIIRLYALYNSVPFILKPSSSVFVVHFYGKTEGIIP